MRTWPSSSAVPRASANTCNAWAVCFVARRESARSSTSSPPAQLPSSGGQSKGGSALLPQPLLVASTHLEGERIVPHYLSERDEPWLGLLLQEYRRFAGRKCSELREHLKTAGDPCAEDQAAGRDARAR